MSVIFFWVTPESVTEELGWDVVYTRRKSLSTPGYGIKQSGRNRIESTLYRSTEINPNPSDDDAMPGMGCRMVGLIVVALHYTRHIHPLYRASKRMQHSLNITQK